MQYKRKALGNKEIVGKQIIKGRQLINNQLSIILKLKIRGNFFDQKFINVFTPKNLGFNS